VNRHKQDYLTYSACFARTIDSSRRPSEPRASSIFLTRKYVSPLKNPAEYAFIEPMRRYEELAATKLEDKYQSEVEKYCIKNTINSGTGILGQADPRISETTNPPAYHTLLAESHLIMSRIFHRYHSEEHPIYYTDTDSFFYDYPVSETIATLEPCPTLPFQILKTVPVAVDVKGTSRPEGAVIFRGKMYYQSPDNQAASGWKPNPRSFGEIVEGKLRFVDVERQVIRKWKTRDRAAAILKVGRWHIKKERYGLDTIKRLLRADNKRHRANYDSYQLFLDDEKQGSRAWTLDEAYGHMLDDRSLGRTVETAAYE
jgi:hypothetical protein